MLKKSESYPNYAINLKRTYPVCKACGNSLDDADRVGDYYGCITCDSWVMDVDYKLLQPVLALNIKA